MCHVNWLWAPMWTHLGPTYFPPSFQLSFHSSDTTGSINPLHLHLSLCGHSTLPPLIRVQRGPLISWSCVSGQPEPQLIICPMNGSDGFTMGGAVVLKIGRNVVEMWISISVKECDCMQPLTHTHTHPHISAYECPTTLIWAHFDVQSPSPFWALWRFEGPHFPKNMLTLLVECGFLYQVSRICVCEMAQRLLVEVFEWWA